MVDLEVVEHNGVQQWLEQLRAGLLSKTGLEGPDNFIYVRKYVLQTAAPFRTTMIHVAVQRRFWRVLAFLYKLRGLRRFRCILGAGFHCKK